MNVITTVPKHTIDRWQKLRWASKVLRAYEKKHDGQAADLLVLPQEYIGGIVPTPDAPHVELAWMQEKFGRLAERHGVHIGVGGAIVDDSSRAHEDYLYFDDEGQLVGSHRKFALPRYDHIQAGGSGQLYPETNFQRRSTVIELPKLGLRVGTVFCWEVFSLATWAAYSYQGVNLIVHPIKFAPQGWLKVSKAKDGPLTVIGFSQDKKNNLWVERLHAASKFEVYCPIIVACNTWALGDKYKALCGVIDEVHDLTELRELGSSEDAELAMHIDLKPYQLHGFENQRHPKQYSDATDGTLDGFAACKRYTMASKMRRIEAQLAGGGAAVDIALYHAAQWRAKKRTATSYARLLEDIAEVENQGRLFDMCDEEES